MILEHDENCNVRLGFHKGEICNCHPKPMKTDKKVARHPKSRCICGHTGDGANSDHKDMLNPGHGACRICKCPKFVWVEFFVRRENEEA